MVGLDVGIQTSDPYTKRPMNKPLIITNSIGLIVMLVWSFVAFRAVKHESKGMAWMLTIFLPIMYILPVVDIVLGEQNTTPPSLCCAKQGLVADAALSTHHYVPFTSC